MKKIFSAAIAAFLGFAFISCDQGNVNSVDKIPFFLNKLGAEAKYVSKEANGTVVSYYTIKITEMNIVDEMNFSGKYTETYEGGIFDDVDVPDTGYEYTFTVRDGNVERATVVSTSEIMSSIMEGFGFTEAMMVWKTEGSPFLLPADISVGDEARYSFSETGSFTEAGASMMAMLGITVAAGTEIGTANLSGKMTTVAKESLTTPAGTFDCFKNEGEIEITITPNPLFAQFIDATLLAPIRKEYVEWIAPGIGTVRNETFDEQGNPEGSEELISLKGE
jgi:hypothetical protein